MPDILVTVRKDDALAVPRAQTPYHAVFSARLATVVFHHVADEERLIQLGITDGEGSR